MGFLLSSSGLVVLYIAINVFNMYYGDDWKVFSSPSRYGIGGSSMALFVRVGGGIYTKAVKGPVLQGARGLAGLIIGFVTEYYTSSAYSPVQDVADSCRTGAATNVIFGLALGYKSVIIPIFAIVVSTYVSFSIAAMYRIAMAALGMLSTMATGLAIDAYGPISDNAGGIVEMAGMSHRVRERTDGLDAAGATSARWMAMERSSSCTSICCSTARFTTKRRSS
ncbi:hypothetical protein ZWY2020_051178 [Hordeum vulgare]|nr:hypothetical protein ZWY2020_051178 [Hordeum vulgare]